MTAAPISTCGVPSAPVRPHDLQDEMHGVLRAQKIGGPAGTQSVTIAADGSRVRLALSEGMYPAGLTPRQARHLARKLHRLARIVEGAAQ